MRFMIIHKNDPQTEAGLPPPPELVQKIGAFIGQYAQSGRFIDGQGLAGSKARTRLVFRGGRSTVKPGPYSGEHELPAVALVLKVRTDDEALGWANRYGKLLGDGELELGKVNEPWDIGVMPQPESPPLRFLLIDKADAASEGSGRSKKLKADLTRLRSEMTKAGVLVSTIELEPSRRGKRLVFTNNDLRMMDGPFAESKELIGGFALLELADMAEAIAMCKPYAEILGGTLEIDIRLVAPAEDDG